MDSKAFEKHFEEYALETWPEAGDRKKNGWLLAAVQAHKHWGQGKEVTRPELEEALAEVQGIRLGGGGPPEQA